MKQRNTILTITGSDGSGGAGIQADIKVITSLGGYAVSVITSITMQNTLGIQRFYDIPADVVAEQVEALIDDIKPSVVKVGMVRNVKTLENVVSILAKRRPPQLIYDPVVTSSQGDLLMPPEMIDSVKTKLLPLCSLVILKQNDAVYLLNSTLKTHDDIVNGMRKLLDMGCRAVLLHSGDDHDFIAWQQDDDMHVEPSPTLWQTNAHGLGSNLTSAIAYFLGETDDFREAISRGNAYIHQQMSEMGELKGRGSELLNAFMKAVSTHYATNNDVRFYADMLNVSPRYLGQVTKRIVQKTPKTLIDEHVFHESKFLLDTTSKTVQEIAYALGFNSQSHFTKFFKKMGNSTPSIYRQKQIK